MSKKVTLKKTIKKEKKSIIQEAQRLPGQILKESIKQSAPFMDRLLLPQKVVFQIADEVAKRLKRRASERKNQTRPKIENPLFIDTSAIIDDRLMDLVKLGVFYGNLVILESVLSELKNIADSKDDVKKDRGRRALKRLEEIKKQKEVKLVTLKDEIDAPVVDDSLIQHAKKYKGRLITCDYNLYKKAKISNVVAIDIHEMANVLKTQAIPGEQFWVRIVQSGKGKGQGVGHLPDGTMIVLENGDQYLGKTVQVIVSRIIQTDAGRILFARAKETN